MNIKIYQIDMGQNKDHVCSLTQDSFVKFQNNTKVGKNSFLEITPTSSEYIAIGETVYGIKQLEHSDRSIEYILLQGKIICIKILETRILVVVSIESHFGYPSVWAIDDFGTYLFRDVEKAQTQLKHLNSSR